MAASPFGAGPQAEWEDPAPPIATPPASPGGVELVDQTSRLFLEFFFPKKSAMTLWVKQANLGPRRALRGGTFDNFLETKTVMNV